MDSEMETLRDALARRESEIDKVIFAHFLVILPIFWSCLPMFWSFLPIFGHFGGPCRRKANARDDCVENEGTCSHFLAYFWSFLPYFTVCLVMFTRFYRIFGH